MPQSIMRIGPYGDCSEKERVTRQRSSGLRGAVSSSY